MRSPAWTLALAALLLARPARADDVESARKHFTEGVERYQNGDFEGARALFQEAEKEHHAAPIVYNIARAEERLGHPQAAVDAYEAYVTEAGEKGEFTQAAVIAIARIRSRAGQLRIETKPPGARIFVDGTQTRDPAPTRMLVPAGRHHVVAEGDGWRAETDVEAAPSATAVVSLEKSEPASNTPPPSEPSPTPSLTPPAAASETSDGFVMGGQFVIIPHRFDNKTGSESTSFGLAAGLMLEAGFAPASSFVFFGRAMFAAGSKGSPATVLDSIGMAGSYRLHRVLWVGAAFQVGRALLPGADVSRPEDQVRFDTDYVFCPTLEVSVAVITRPYGQWLISAFPGYYFASPKDNDALFVPIGFGLRTF